MIGYETVVRPDIVVRSNRITAVEIEVAGINFVGTYRATFGDIIDRKGIQGLIDELKSKNGKLAS